MGQPDATGVDIGAVLAAAGRCDHLADVVDDVFRTHVTQLSFGAATAGRAHVSSGAAVRDAIELLGDDVRSWSRACAEIGSALRASATGYLTADARGSARLG
jgi:hypothetical protein